MDADKACRSAGKQSFIQGGMNMSLLIRNTQQLDGSKKIRAPGEKETLQRIDSYLAVLEDNRNASRFVPNDALLALDMASFVCERLHGRQERRFIPAMRLSLSLVQTEQETAVQ